MVVFCVVLFVFYSVCG